MKSFSFILVLTWLPGILSSQNQLVLNSQSENSELQDPGSACIQYLSGLPNGIKLPDLRDSGFCDLPMINDKYTIYSPSGINLAMSKMFFLDLKVLLKSSTSNNERAKEMVTNAKQTENLDIYYYDQSLEESTCLDRIMTISGEYLLTDNNYSIVNKNGNK